MNEDKILRLLHSTNWDDVLLGINFMSKLDDPKGFFRKNSRVMNGQSTEKSIKEIMA